MIVCIFERVQWRWARNGSVTLGLGGGRVGGVGAVGVVHGAVVLVGGGGRRRRRGRGAAPLGGAGRRPAQVMPPRGPAMKFLHYLMVSMERCAEGWIAGSKNSQLYLYLFTAMLV